MALSAAAALAKDPIQDTTTKDKETAEKAPQAPGDGGYPVPNFSLWTKWALVSLLCYAIPIYKKVLRLEDEAEKITETLAEDVVKVAAVVEKVAANIANSLPEDTIVEYDFVMVEHIAETMIEDAEKVEAFIQKVDVMKEKVEKVMEPYVKEEEELIKEEGKVAS